MFPSYHSINCYLCLLQNTSAVRCEEFLQFFTSKVGILGAAFPLCDSDSSACLSHLTCLVKMISSMKTTTWALVLHTSERHIQHC